MVTVAIILASLVLLAACAWVGYVLVARRQRRGVVSLAELLPVHSAWWRDHAKREGQLLYVAIGDSAAQGIGASLPHRGYVGTVAAHIRHVTGKSVRVINLSVSGARLREAIAEQLPRLADIEADVMTVAIGANDVASFDRIRFDAELRELLAAIPPHAIVADVPCFFYGEPERRVRIANAILHQAGGERHLTIAPLYAATRRQGSARAAMNQVAADFFHPNDRGYRVWASAFLPLVDRALSSLTARR